jgi:hypothetical protein
MDDWDGGTITEGWRALALFTDRVQAGRRFLASLNDDPARVTVSEWGSMVGHSE